MVDTAAYSRSIYFDDTICEVRSVAYDGVWRSTVPNPIASYRYDITGASRINVVIACTESSGLYYTTDFTAEPLVKFAVTGSNSISNLETWTPERPIYLTDLTAEDIEDDSFTVTISFESINGVTYDMDTPLATVSYGKVQQWTIDNADLHPYHMHLYHMQIVTPGGCGAIYYEEGQWFDVIFGRLRLCTVRFNVTDVGGRTMLECHILQHGD